MYWWHELETYSHSKWQTLDWLELQPQKQIVNTDRKFFIEQLGDNIPIRWSAPVCDILKLHLIE